MRPRYSSRYSTKKSSVRVFSTISETGVWHLWMTKTREERS